MKKTESELQSLLDSMGIQEKILQLSCSIPLLFQKHGELSDEMMEKAMPQGLGRMTQFASGFFEGGVQSAQGYNEIQKFNLQHDPHKIPLLMQNEAIAGLVAAKATVFPIPMAVASTWISKNAQDMGKVIEEEARAIGVRMALAPVADVARDARWGRVGETYGEDPFLVTQFSIAMCKGLQQENYGNHVAACAKHFLGYAASETGINKAKTPLSKKELLEVHGMPFAGMIKEANLQGVMVTYNEIDGLPMSVNEYYTNDILRDEYGFKGTAICDAMSIPSCQLINGIGKNMEEVVGWALAAGIDADTPITSVYQKIETGIEQGYVKEINVNKAVLRVLRQKNELGLFDNAMIDAKKADEIMNRDTAKSLSRQIAQQAITLLKNDGGILPICKKTKKITVMGPFANRVSTMFGDYSYVKFIEMFANSCLNKKSTMEGVATFFDKLVDKEFVKEVMQLDETVSYSENVERYVRNLYNVPTLFEAMRGTFYHSEINLCKGTSGAKGWKQEIEEACNQAKQSDIIIVTTGEVTGFGEDATSGEGKNCGDLNLPSHQIELLIELRKLAKPIVLILCNGRPLLLQEAALYCDAIVEAWYPGPYGAQAICDVISGKVNPGGKLPMTFPKYSHQCPIYYGNKAGSGYLKLNYKCNEAVEEPMYPFGFGLSYTSFFMSLHAMPEEVIIKDKIIIEICIENTGKCDGDEVVQVYSSTIHASVVRPIKELRAFKRIHLKAKERAIVTFGVDTKQFGFYNRRDEFVLEPAKMIFMIGNNAHDIQIQKEIELIGETCKISDERVFSFDEKVSIMDSH